VGHYERSNYLGGQRNQPKKRRAKQVTVKWENTLSSLKSRKKIRRKTSLDDVPA
jgi:hypothetical protein